MTRGQKTPSATGAEPVKGRFFSEDILPKPSPNHGKSIQQPTAIWSAASIAAFTFRPGAFTTPNARLNLEARFAKVKAVILTALQSAISHSGAACLFEFQTI